jgi:hypothetical protein
MNETQEKKVNPAILAAADIQLKYFGKEPTTLTLKEIKNEVLDDYEHLMTLEVGMLFLLIDGWYANMQKAVQSPEVAS